MNFFKTPALLKYLYPNLLWDKKRDTNGQAPTLYLTFDDGPVPDVTPFVWDTLAQFDARATFFCVGDNVDRYPDLYQETVRQQHTVGNHTYHHVNGWHTKDHTYQQDIAQCAQALRSHHPSAVEPSSLFRPPYGKIKRRQIKALKAAYTVVMWDILSGDFDPTFDAEACLQKSIRHTRTGTIIIFHDSYKAQKNLTYVLPRYLEHFARAGYTFHAL